MGAHCRGIGRSSRYEGHVELRGHVGDWSRLADALLPDDVPVLAEAKRAVEARTELVSSGAAPEAIRDAWNVLDVLAERAAIELKEASPRMAQLRDELSARVQELHTQERQALVVLEGAP